MARRQARLDRRTAAGAGATAREVAASRQGGPAAQYTEVFGDALVEEAERDPRVSASPPRWPAARASRHAGAELPDQYYDVGIAEQHAVLFAAGLALEGMKPVAAVYSTFLQRAYDQIIHDVCLQKLDVAFCMDRAGLVGDDGPTHHGAYDVSFRD